MKECDLTKVCMSNGSPLTPEARENALRFFYAREYVDLTADLRDLEYKKEAIVKEMAQKANEVTQAKNKMLEQCASGHTAIVLPADKGHMVVSVDLKQGDLGKNADIKISYSWRGPGTY